MLRPCTPGLIGLAITVFLWGLGYKLSLYQPHCEVARKATMAKLWTGPRGVSLAISSTPRSVIHPVRGCHALLPKRLDSSHSECAAACILRAPALLAAVPAGLLSSRAPPSLRFA